MISREELSSKAELKSDEAEALEQEAVKLEEQGLPSQALRKVRQAARLHHEARILRRRAHLLLVEQIGKRAMRASLSSLLDCIQRLHSRSCFRIGACTQAAAVLLLRQIGSRGGTDIAAPYWLD